MGKKVWEFNLEDGKHTVALEYGDWSGRRRISVDGVSVIRTGWQYAEERGSVDNFEVSGVPCVVERRPHLWAGKFDLYIKGKLVEEEEARRERIRQTEKVDRTKVYEESEAGVLRRIKEAFTSDFATQAREALLRHLRSLGVEVEYVDERQQMAKLTGQSIDGIIIFETNNPDQRDCAHYVVFGMGSELASRLKAKSKEVKEHRLRGKVRSVRWVGGPVVQSLNSDVDLLQLQVQEGQTSIEVKPDKINHWVRIVIPAPGRGKWVARVTPVPGFPGVISEQLPSRATFNLYNRIAEHIRNYMRNKYKPD